VTLPPHLSDWPEAARVDLVERAGIMYGARDLTPDERAAVIADVRRAWAAWAAWGGGEGTAAVPSEEMPC